MLWRYFKSNSSYIYVRGNVFNWYVRKAIVGGSLKINLNFQKRKEVLYKNPMGYFEDASFIQHKNNVNDCLVMCLLDIFA